MSFILHHLDLLIFLAVCATVPVMAVSAWLRRLRRAPEPRRWVRWTWTALFGVEICCLLYAQCLEPGWLEVTTHRIALDGLEGDLRVVHITDLHLQADSESWMEQILDEVAQAQPDLILLTGDFLDRQEQAANLREFFERLVEIAGADRVFAVTGNFEAYTRVEQELADSGVAFLDGVAVAHTRRSAAVQIAGIGYHYQRISEGMLKDLAAQMDGSIPSLLLHHTPDLAEAPGIEAFDLVLCGHTHGGQIRLPFYGALITLSRYGKRYEAGLYRLGGKTRMYVNRGLGTEPMPGLRLRFLCRPEVAVFELAGSAPAGNR